MQGFYRNHMEEVIKFFETNHKVSKLHLDIWKLRIFMISHFLTKIILPLFPGRDRE